MPDVILEVLSLTVQLGPNALAAKPEPPPVPRVKPRPMGVDGWIKAEVPPPAPPAPPIRLEATSTSCEIWPAWDNTGARFVTTHAGPAEIDNAGCAIWRHMSSELPSQHGIHWDNSDPLMAILVSVSPPGGIARIARQRLCVSVRLSDDTDSRVAEGLVLATSESELLLNHLITAQEGQHVSVTTQTEILRGDGLTVEGTLSAVISWVPAPPGVRGILGPPAMVPADTASPPASPPKRQASPASERPSSPSKSAGVGARTAPMGRRLGAPGDCMASRSAERALRAREKQATAEATSAAGPSYENSSKALSGASKRSQSRERVGTSPARPGTASSKYPQVPTSARPGARPQGGRPQSGSRRCPGEGSPNQGTKCGAEAEAEAEAAPAYGAPTLAQGW